MNAVTLGMSSLGFLLTKENTSIDFVLSQQKKMKAYSTKEMGKGKVHQNMAM